MPQYVITSPDGKKYKITAPDGATQDQVLAYAKTQFGAQKPGMSKEMQIKMNAALSQSHDSEMADPTRDMSATELALARTGKTFHDLGTGVKQLAALAQGDTTALQQDVAQERQRDAPLVRETPVAGVLSNAAVTAPAFMLPGAQTVVGASIIGGGLGALQPTVSQKERALNTAAGAVTAATSQSVANKLNLGIARREAEAKAAENANAIRDATLREGQKAGYIVPPGKINPGLRNSAMEGFAGRPQMEDMASVHNQQVTDALAKKTLGLPPDALLAPKTFDALRKSAGQVYEAVKGSGTIVADQQYLDDIVQMSAQSKNVSVADPAVARNIEALSDRILKADWNAEEAVETVKQLRSFAGRNMRDGADAATFKLGAVQKDAADVLDDLIGRHLQAQGQKDLYTAWHNARQLIAKSYSVEGATNESGHVVGQRILAEGRKGAPLSGELDLIARFSSSFAKEARPITETRPQFSGTDFMVGGGGMMGAAATGNPAALAAVGYPLARFGARQAAMSPLGQAMLARPNYAANAGLASGLESQAPLPALLAALQAQQNQ